MIELLFIILFAIGLNWTISLHHIYQSVESVRQKATVVLLAVIIGLGLGVIAVL